MAAVFRVLAISFSYLLLNACFQRKFCSYKHDLISSIAYSSSELIKSTSLFEYYEFKTTLFMRPAIQCTCYTPAVNVVIDGGWMSAGRLSDLFTNSLWDY